MHAKRPVAVLTIRSRPARWAMWQTWLNYHCFLIHLVCTCFYRRALLVGLALLDLCQNQGSPGREVGLDVIASSVPSQRVCEVVDRVIHASMTPVLFGVGVKHNFVLARSLHTNSVIRITVGPVEIKDEEQACPFKDNNLVRLVLERDVRLRCREPLVLAFRVVHASIEVVQVSISE